MSGTESQKKIEFDVIQKALRLVSNRAQAFEITKNLCLWEENQDKNQGSGLNNKVGYTFYIFAKTQEICHTFLKQAKTNKNLFNPDTLKELITKSSEETSKDKVDDNQEMLKHAVDDNILKKARNFFPELDYQIYNFKDDNKDITNFFYQLQFNTYYFIYFINEYIGSINQYFKDVKEKYCSNQLLVKMKKLFYSFNNIPESAIHLVKLYRNALDEHGVKEYTFDEKKVMEILSPEPSNKYQLENLIAFLERIKKGDDDNAEEAKEEEEEASTSKSSDDVQDVDDD